MIAKQKILRRYCLPIVILIIVILVIATHLFILVVLVVLAIIIVGIVAKELQSEFDDGINVWCDLAWAAKDECLQCLQGVLTKLVVIQIRVLND